MESKELMSHLANRCHARYSYRMTELKPLEYAASLVVFLVIVAIAATWHLGHGFRQAAEDQGLHVMRYVAGKTLGILAALAIPAAWSIHAMVELWSPYHLARKPKSWLEAVKLYPRRQFHIAQHAA